MQEVSYKVAVAELSQSPYYRAIVHEIERRCPVIPVFDYEGRSNIEEIKFKLAQKAMHELVLTVLKGKVE